MLSQKWIWGAVPEGFARIVDRDGDHLLVRQDRVGQIEASICRDQRVTSEPARYQGRVALQSIRLPDGETALVRTYRHGGLLRRMTGGWFFTWPPRPFRELAITEELRRRGLRTVEVYAACVRRAVGPFYRGWLVTRELHGATDMWSALQSDTARHGGVRNVLKAAAEVVRAMHREGVYHADLNLKNLLIRSERGDTEGYVIDFDKARLFLGDLPAELAHNNLKRLLRSARKLDPDGRHLTTAAWQDFLMFYQGGSNA